MNKKIVMRYPSTWHGDMWREGAPFGNGLIGGLVYGGVFKENILINHAFLWHGGKNQELPDVSDSLPEIRRLLDEKKIVEADSYLSNALLAKGYKNDVTRPYPLADILINTPSSTPFSHYRRTIDMEKAEVTVSWMENDVSFTRSTFVSRENNRIFTRFRCDKGTFSTSVTAAIHDTESKPDVDIPQQESHAEGSETWYAAYNESIYHAGDYGLYCRVITDGKTEAEDSTVRITDATEVLIVGKVFLETPRAEAIAQIRQELSGTFDYDRELAAHAALHGKYFNAVDFSISDPEKNTSNEELLLESFEKEPSNELMEKLYAYGRYLFICSTAPEGTLPCHLIGLFNGSYQCFWAFNMYNVNFEMIYWQALSGNLPEFMRLALDYTENMMPDLRENARKIFGCRGILINSVNTPESGLYKCNARHIVNWTGGAPWFAQHFYDYYRFTGDIDYLKEHALPFMYETALFYEDFAVEAEDGYYDLYPSVSPENTASNVAKDMKTGGIETCKNATMELALMKELLTNLITGCELTGMYPEKLETWKKMLTKIRPYQVNEDGAVKEWTDPFYEDNYHHRHHSHVYPIFPGCEITKKDPIYPAFVKAEDLRLQYGISDQSSWSMVFMSGIAARMERADLALSILETISRTCLMNNFFTLHNDWRRMGPVACADMRAAPFQIDGNIGMPGVINEMLLQSQMDDLFILPALPAKWKTGHIKGLLARGNILCDICWNEKGGRVILRHQGTAEKTMRLGSGYRFSDGTAEKPVTINGTAEIAFTRL